MALTPGFDPAHIALAEKYILEGGPISKVRRRLSETLKITPGHSLDLVKKVTAQWQAQIPGTVQERRERALEIFRGHYEQLMKLGEYREATKTLMHIARVEGVYSVETTVSVNNQPVFGVNHTGERERLQELLARHGERVKTLLMPEVEEEPKGN